MTPLLLMKPTSQPYDQLAGQTADKKQTVLQRQSHHSCFPTEVASWPSSLGSRRSLHLSENLTFIPNESRACRGRVMKPGQTHLFTWLRKLHHQAGLGSDKPRPSESVEDDVNSR